jgi:hypothetical protein
VLLGVVFSSWRTIEPGYVGIGFDKARHQITNAWALMTRVPVTHIPSSICL